MIPMRTNGWIRTLVFLQLLILISVCQAEEYASIVVNPKERNVFGITVTFHTEAADSDRLLLTSLSVEIAQRKVGDQNLGDSSVYGWFVKEEQNQLWVGKVVKAGETSGSLTLTIPALREDERQKLLEPAKYKLFISLEPEEGLPAFLSRRPGLMSYIPIRSAEMNVKNGIKIDNFVEWLGWQRKRSNTFVWSAEDSSTGHLYAVFEWEAPYDDLVVTPVALISAFVFGMIMSNPLAGLNGKAIVVARHLTSALIIVLAIIALYYSFVSKLVAFGIIVASVGFYIGPYLPSKVKEVLEKVRG